ncbi:MAG: NAD(P)-dependent oxidoreductase [Bacteroidota bacterium]
MKEAKTLILGNYQEDYVSKIRELIPSTLFLPTFSQADLAKYLPETEILFLRSKPKMDRETIDVAKNLKLILRAGVGLDHLDLDYLAEKNILVRSTPGANADAVAEQTIGMLLSLLHFIVKADREVSQFIWSRSPNRGTELSSLCVGIIGYGHTGSAVGKRIQHLAGKTLAYDKYKSGFAHDMVQEVELEQLLAEADVITFHVPLTEETMHWVNEVFLKKLQKPIWLLNLARGPVVKLSSLLPALESGKLKGVALDVLEHEPLKKEKLREEDVRMYESLLNHPLVIASPHIGGWSHQSEENILNTLYQHVTHYLTSS